jgi:hypothetical protein
VKPLGDYKDVRWWSGKPRSWAPDSKWRAWFGGKVIDGLCEVFDEHLAARPGREMRPAAIGCVPWLTSDAVIDRLLKLDACCIVIDKGTSACVARLMDSRLGFQNAAISALERMTPAVNGEAMVVGLVSERVRAFGDVRYLQRLSNCLIVARI